MNLQVVGFLRISFVKNQSPSSHCMAPIAWRPLHGAQKKMFVSDSVQAIDPTLEFRLLEVRLSRSDCRLESAQKRLFPENPRRTPFFIEPLDNQLIAQWTSAKRPYIKFTKKGGKAPFITYPNG